MALFKKRDVPEKLPSLAVEDVNELLKTKREPARKVEDTLEITQTKSVGSAPTFNEGDRGFFKDLLENLNKNSGDMDKLNSWYKDKFLPEDIVHQMREYWEGKQPNLNNLGGELKNKLLQKAGKLHQLEREWQEVYFNLLFKEEEIRREEKELKETLSELMSMFDKSSSKKPKKKK